MGSATISSLQVHTEGSSVQGCVLSRVARCVSGYCSRPYVQAADASVLGTSPKGSFNHEIMQWMEVGQLYHVSDYSPAAAHRGGCLLSDGCCSCALHACREEPRDVDSRLLTALVRPWDRTMWRGPEDAIAEAPCTVTTSKIFADLCNAMR